MNATETSLPTDYDDAVVTLCMTHYVALKNQCIASGQKPTLLMAGWYHNCDACITDFRSVRYFG